MNDLPGTSIDGYRIISLVGKGSIGTVFKASDSSGAYFAIKIMELHPFIDASVLDAVLENALASSRLSECARIVRVYKVGRVGELYYIVMDFMEGGTLERIVEDRSIPMDERLRIGLSLSQTIACIHSKGVIHGDIKPGNVLMDSADVPYVTDFYYSSLKKGFGILPQGTPRYMSPEQATGQFITTSSDIYSFGVLMYELLTGFIPYKDHAGNIAGMINIVSKSEIVPPSERVRGLDGKICGILMKMLQKKPEDRYQGMQQVASELESFLEPRGKHVKVPAKSVFERMREFFRK